ncbi:unnamed protein product [Cunninghamella echinulata]
MSGSDIRDILQIKKPTGSPQPRKSKQPTEKRPEGFSRELYSLIGSAPSVSFVQPIYKAKFNLKKKATPWVLQSFSNPARGDDLELQHWIKAADANHKDYPFAKFDKPKSILIYTDKEYNKVLKDPKWSKSETDYLMELCQKYNHRFQIIADRYEYDSERPRSIEDIKERYCIIQIKLHQLRGTEAPPSLLTFNKEKEIERKNALETLYHRTEEQQQKEAELLAEVNRIENNKNKLQKERENLLYSLQQEELRQLHNNIPSNTNKKSAATTTDTKKKKKRKTDDNEIQEPVMEDKKLTTGVYIRSEKLPIIKPTMQPKVLKVLNELSIGARPVMPTANVCHKFENLEYSILTLFEMKKVVDKMEIEHQITKKQKVNDDITNNQKKK